MHSPSLLVVEHLSIAGLARAQKAFTDLQVTLVRTQEREEVPSLGSFDGVVILGGPQSAYSEECYPTRGAELMLIREALERNVPFLGVCLGAQLLSVVAGGGASRGTGAELGWTEVTFLEAREGDPLFDGMPSRAHVMESHSDQVLLPRQGVLLATGKRYPVQAFRASKEALAWGTQFHAEAGEEFVSARRRLLSEWMTFPEQESELLGMTHQEAWNPLADELFMRFSRLVQRQKTRALLEEGSRHLSG